MNDHQYAVRVSLSPNNVNNEFPLCWLFFHPVRAFVAPDNPWVPNEHLMGLHNAMLLFTSLSDQAFDRTKPGVAPAFRFVDTRSRVDLYDVTDQRVVAYFDLIPPENRAYGTLSTIFSPESFDIPKDSVQPNWLDVVGEENQWKHCVVNDIRLLWPTLSTEARIAIACDAHRRAQQK